MFLAVPNATDDTHVAKAHQRGSMGCDPLLRDSGGSPRRRRARPSQCTPNAVRAHYLAMFASSVEPTCADGCIIISLLGCREASTVLGELDLRLGRTHPNEVF